MLEIKELSLCVDGGKNILDHINLTIDDGKFVVITGPNGGGKSTLVKTIMGIMQPTSGQILLDGEDITSLSVSERARRGIAFAFQQPVRFKGITVRDMLSLAAGGELNECALCRYLSEVGLCALDYIDREIDGSLSGGEIKRIELAMAIARECRLSIFDEPEAGIDLWSFNNLIDVFEKMRKKIRGTIIVISHQERILNIADELIVLSNGAVSARGSRDEILPELMAGGMAAQFCMGRERIGNE